MAAKTIEVMQAGYFSYQSTNPIELIEIIEAAIVYGVIDLSGVAFMPSSNMVFGQEGYACSERLADAIYLLEITSLEIAQHMVTTVGNGNAFGYLDLFPLKMLESIPADDAMLNQILVDTPSQIKAVERIPAPEEAARLEAMLEAAKTDPDLAVGLKLHEILENVSMYATIIRYDELAANLKNLPAPEGVKDFTASLKNLAQECKELILSNAGLDKVSNSPCSMFPPEKMDRSDLEMDKDPENQPCRKMLL